MLHDTTQTKGRAANCSNNLLGRLTLESAGSKQQVLPVNFAQFLVYFEPVSTRWQFLTQEGQHLVKLQLSQCKTLRSLCSKRNILHWRTLGWSCSTPKKNKRQLLVTHAVQLLIHILKWSWKGCLNAVMMAKLTIVSCGVSIRTVSGCLWEMLWLDTNVVQVLGRQLLKFCKDVNLNVWSGSGFSPVRLEGDLNRVLPQFPCWRFKRNQGGGRQVYFRKRAFLFCSFKSPCTKIRSASTAKPWTV